MILYFERRISSWGSEFDIYDETGKVLYGVRGKLSAAGNFLLMDTDGSLIGEMKEVFLSVIPQMILKKREEPIAVVKKKGFIHHYYEIDNGWIIDGDTARWDWSLKEQDGSEVARISRRVVNGQYRYAVETADNVDEVDVILVILAVDTERCNQGLIKKTIRTLKE